MGLIFWTLASLPSYMAIPIAIGESYAQFHIVGHFQTFRRQLTIEGLKSIT